MGKKFTSILALLLCMGLLLMGCQGAKDTVTEAVSTQQDDQENKSEVRSAFKQEDIAPTEAVEEETEQTPETETEIETETETEIETETELETETEIEMETETETETENIDGIVASEDTFDYVALGNSVTCNEIEPGLWWGNWGMAASSESKDYVHLVSAWLGGQSARPVTTTVLDLKKWEVAQVRDSLLPDYEQYFNEHTDLVTIQTGENITSFKETLGADYANLVKRIKEKAPNAQVLMLGETLWPSEDIESAKRAACSAYGVTFVEMTDFLNGYEGLYKSALGVEVSGADGGRYAIQNEVVAAHPNDEGMACIAQRVIDQITIR